MTYPEHVTIVEVGPRDGLQNEPRALPVATRIALIESLAEAGLPMIETGSFVSPRWVPQMADTDAVLQGLRRRPGVAYTALVPNLQGFQAAVAAGADEVAVFAAASETFSRRNINCGIAASIRRFEPVLQAAAAIHMRVRGYVSCVLGCPYEGDVAPAQVAAVTEELLELGCYQVSLGDTIGVGTPLVARNMLACVAERVPMERLAAHFHDTYGQALANLLACLQIGLRTLDSSVAGLGGCPYAAGASGNVATEDVLYMLRGLGIETGVDLAAVASVGRRICEQLCRKPSSRVSLAIQNAKNKI